MKEKLYEIADELRAIANIGLRFCENGYDQERYQHILTASARLVAAVENASADEILAAYRGNLAHFSPLQGVEAAVFREGKVLLIRRQDDGLWALPGGLAEVGETLAQAVERELWEEAGVRGKAAELLGIFDSRLWRSPSRMQITGFVFRVETQDGPAVRPDGDYTVSPHNEVLETGFFGEAALPPLSPGHDLRVPMLFRLNRAEVPAPFFDR
jgi:8-oxo-dGTP pyrophosphatase MutT (NUDIX family)